MTGWPLVPLGEILVPVSRPQTLQPNMQYRLLGAHWYAEGLYVKDIKTGSEIQAKQLYQVSTADFVYNRLFAWKGSFAIAESDVDGCYVSNEFPCFRLKEARADGRFLKYYFSRESVWSEALGLSSGGTPTSRNRLKEERLLAMSMPLPPIEEQRRIVRRINEIGQKIGRLTTLRAAAAKETETLSSSSVESVFVELSNRNGLSTVEQVCHSVTDGDHQSPHFSDEGIKFIFVGNASSGLFHFANCKYVTHEYFSNLKPQRVPKRGDMLYTAVGATLGVAAVVDTDEPFCFQRHVAILKPDRSRIDSRFMWHMLRSQTVFRKAWASTTGSAQPTVPLRAIKQLLIPVPPLSEQRIAVDRLDELQDRLDRLAKHQCSTQREIEAVLPSVLNRAFHGEL